jgi:4-diphosphocytidyl-2-C-methyl-D-erythritol kinase
MLCFPNAKINIGLHIVERRPDGFHNLETIFCPIALSDILEILVNAKPSGNKAVLSVTGMEISGEPESNLCVKAYRLLDADFDLPPVNIHLHKIIPMGAGMGGGSSDGAFTITLLNQLFELGLSHEQMEAYAARLGSDCAFFVRNKPAFGTGKGNILKNIPLNLLGYYMVVVKPAIFVGTAEAYSAIHPAKPAESVEKLIRLPMEQWRNTITNDFEAGIFSLHPTIREIKETLYGHGAVYASMSGSGSAVYGIFKTEVMLKNIFKDCFYWAKAIE